MDHPSFLNHGTKSGIIEEKIILISTVFCTLVSFVVLFSGKHLRDGFNKNETIPMQNGWILSDENYTAEHIVELPISGGDIELHKVGTTYHLTRILPKDLTYSYALSIPVQSAGMTVYIDSIERLDFTGTGGLPKNNLPSSGFLMIPLSSEDSGKPIEITVSSKTSTVPGFGLPLAGGKSDILISLFFEVLPDIMAGLMLIIFGIYIYVSRLFSKGARDYSLVNTGIGVFSLILGVWELLNGGTIQLLTGNMAGMDRYGVSDKSVTSVAGANKATVFDDNYQGYTNLNLMRRGTDNGNPFKIYTNISDEINKSVLTTTNVRQLNKGQVTEYPYGIDESITVSKTHSQWFVVDLEATNSKLIDSSKDVVVWYALYSSDSGSYYHLSGVDALNNYYIYSKGNITYSGCGHSEVTKDAELKLFVNTVVKAIKSGNSTPKISSTTGIKTGSNSYEQAIRSNDLSYLSDLTTTTNYLRFTVTDIDMGISNGAYSYGRAFWDVDGDGSFTEGVDVILEEYEGDNCLRNKVENVLDLRDYLNLTNSEGITLYDSLTRGDLVITIYAEDVNKTRGTTSFSLARRDLFDLD